MTKQKYSRYSATSECGMLTRTLERAYDASNIDNDGVSRIFVDTHSTITIAKDTDLSATSNISHRWFSTISMSSMNESPDWYLNSESISF